MGEKSPIWWATLCKPVSKLIYDGNITKYKQNISSLRSLGWATHFTFVDSYKAHLHSSLSPALSTLNSPSAQSKSHYRYFCLHKWYTEVGLLLCLFSFYYHIRLVRYINIKPWALWLVFILPPILMMAIFTERLSLGFWDKKRLFMSCCLTINTSLHGTVSIICINYQVFYAL